MPSLDDLGTKQVATGTPADEDYIPFYDVSEFGGDRLKRSTIASLAEAIGSGPITSADITDAVVNGAAGNGKVLKSSNSLLTGVYPGGIGLTCVFLNELGNYLDAHVNYSTYRYSGVDYIHSRVAKGGYMPILDGYTNEAAAISGGVQVGDVWWDTTSNKARTRLV